MIKHHITRYEENGTLYMEAWMQINIFNRSFCFWKVRRAIKKESEKRIEDIEKRLAELEKKVQPQSHPDNLNIKEIVKEIYELLSRQVKE